MTEVFEGYTATGSGSTMLRLELDAIEAVVSTDARWMGDDAPLQVVLRCRHIAYGSHSGALTLASADGYQLPPSDGTILLEYVRVPPQPIGPPGNDTMAIVGETNATFSLVLWLHRESFYDNGTDLPADQYDPPIATFAPVARMLASLEAPWKLGALEQVPAMRDTEFGL